MTPLKTNREILEYHARKLLQDHLRSNPKQRLKMSDGDSINHIIAAWYDEGRAQQVIKHHRKKFAHLYNTK